MALERKKQLIKQRIMQSYDNIHSPKCIQALKLIDNMADSNIPVGYWLLKIKDFAGSPKLKETIEEYISDIEERFLNGDCLCLVGNQGTGKTLSSIFILKKALLSGFSSYYITASDIVSHLVSSSATVIRNTLRNTDFVVIDEVDSRFFPSDAQKEMFSAMYENVFRHRVHNLLPTIICTNETEDILNVFYGQSATAISSLHSQYLRTIIAAGKDFRKV